MKSVHYMTLAAARNADKEAFDRTIRDAVFAAAAAVGAEVVIKALCGPSRRSSVGTDEFKKAA